MECKDRHPDYYIRHVNTKDIQTSLNRFKSAKTVIYCAAQACNLLRFKMHFLVNWALQLVFSFNILGISKKTSIFAHIFLCVECWKVLSTVGSVYSLLKRNPNLVINLRSVNDLKKTYLKRKYGLLPLYYRD